MKQLDRKTRKLLTSYGQLHPRADIDRLYVARREGGRGLRQLEMTYQMSMISLAKYLDASEDKDVVRHIVQLENSNKVTSIRDIARKIQQQIPETTERDLEGQEVSHNAASALKGELKQKWLTKAMHGQFARLTDKQTTDSSATYAWLVGGRVKGETEALISAAQDQALRTKYHEVKILKTGQDSKCRICKIHDETIYHVASGCPELAKNEYVKRHNQICAYIHWELCRDNKFKTPKRWYQHVPSSVEDSQSVTIIYDEQVHTDRTISANRPDIIVKNKLTRTCTIIDVAVPMDDHVDRKEAEKMLKYRDLSIEVARMWNMKVEVVPVVVGSLGTISKQFTRHLSRIPSSLNANQIQNIAIYGTAHILRRVLE